MKLVTCPHCGHRHVVTNKIPKDVVVVLPCPSCHEFVIFFRERAIGLKREVIENGDFEERKRHLMEMLESNKEHIAEGIAEFLEAGVPWKDADEDDDDLDDTFDEADDLENDDENPITQSEVDRFVKLDLQRIDDASYFRRTFE